MKREWIASKNNNNLEFQGINAIKKYIKEGNLQGKNY